MRLYEVMELPASEINFWQAYYSIFPLPQDRQDSRFAMLAAVIANVSGKSLKRAMKESDFMPHYLQERNKIVVEKSLDQQREEFLAFKAQLQAAQGKVQ